MDIATSTSGNAGSPTDLEAALSRLTSRLPAGPGRTATTTAPFTGAPLAQLPESSADDVAAAFERARAAQRSWAAMSVRERAEPFVRFHDLVLDRQREILDIIQWETGKARRHAFEEVYDAAGGTLHYARSAPRLLRRRRTPGAVPGATRTYHHALPKGAVSVITPWNYPLALPVADAVPALLAGNAVVAKPDTQTALSALWAIDTAIEAGLPEDLWIPVVGRPEEIGDALIENADYVSFTGSSAVGSEVAQRAARRLIGCSAELGGKNPAIVCEDADIDWTVEGLQRACFSNAGQLCIAMERIYVHDAVYDEFAERFAAAVRGMELNADFDYSADMGSLTYQRQFDHVAAHVEDARTKGAEILTGGHARGEVGPLFYEPTVMVDVAPTMDACAAETFGPLVSLYRISDDGEAVEAANATDYGLNASVWTRDTARGRRLAERIRAGTVNINEGYGAAWASYGAPMGGMKQSGLGRRHGAEGLLRYTDSQTVASQHYVGLGGTPGMDGETLSSVLTASARLMKRLRIR